MNHDSHESSRTPEATPPVGSWRRIALIAIAAVMLAMPALNVANAGSHVTQATELLAPDGADGDRFGSQ